MCFSDEYIQVVVNLKIDFMGINLRVLVEVTMRLVAVLSVMLVLSGNVYGQTEHCCSPETFESDLRVSGELLGINLQVPASLFLLHF